MNNANGFQNPEDQSTDLESAPTAVNGVVSSDLDDTGVPLKNRLAEERRKREQLEYRLAELESRLSTQTSPSIDQLRGGQNVSGSESQLSKTAPGSQLTAEQFEEIKNDPERYATYIAESASQKATAQALARVAKVQQDTAVYQEYPELKTPGSPLLMETAKVLNEWKTLYESSNGSFGRNTANDPLALQDAADKAYASLIKSGRITAPAPGAAQQRSAAGAGVAGRNPERTQGRALLTQDEEIMYQGFVKHYPKMTREQYAVALDKNRNRKRGI